MRDAGGMPAGVLASLVELVLPAQCAGCGGGAGWSGVCRRCAAVLDACPGPTRPEPAPPGLPPCFALAGYDGPLRELILAYKERGRRGLAAPLGDALAAVVLSGVRATPGPLVLVPVPTTAAARRARQGDHMLRLSRRAVRRLRSWGHPAVFAMPLRARPRVDSAGLDRHARARVAQHAFAGRPARLAALRALGVPIVLLDDVVTTGATLAAAAASLARAGVSVRLAAVLAATELRHSRPVVRRTGPGLPSVLPDWG
jgi:predicted amidophosphoribosyltransferase